MRILVLYFQPCHCSHFPSPPPSTLTPLPLMMEARWSNTGGHSSGRRSRLRSNTTCHNSTARTRKYTHSKESNLDACGPFQCKSRLDSMCGNLSLSNVTPAGCNQQHVNMQLTSSRSKQSSAASQSTASGPEDDLHMRVGWVHTGRGWGEARHKHTNTHTHTEHQVESSDTPNNH